MRRSKLFWIALAGALIGARLMGACSAMLESEPKPLIIQHLPFNCLPTNECTVVISVLPHETKIELPKLDRFEKNIDNFSVALWIELNNLHLEVTDTEAIAGPTAAGNVKYNVPESVFLVRLDFPEGREEHLIRLDCFANY